MNLVTPKFLTKEIAAQAVQTALQMMHNSPISKLFKRHACHIVILVPAMAGDRPHDMAWPAHALEAHCLYELSVGEKKDWSAPYDDIARSKALQLWHERNDDRTDSQPHLLFPGDTPFWGGVRRNGIAVACSGVQSWFDKMLSGIIADLCVGLAYEAWMTSENKGKNRAFIT